MFKFVAYFMGSKGKSVLTFSSFEATKMIKKIIHWIHRML